MIHRTHRLIPEVKSGTVFIRYLYVYTGISKPPLIQLILQVEALSLSEVLSVALSLKLGITLSLD